MSGASTRPAAGSTKRALAFVYVGYAFRYLYLLVLVPFYGRVLGAAEYGRVLAAMSLFQVVWMLTEYGFPSVGLRDIASETTPQRNAEVYGRHTRARLLTAGLGIAVGAIGTAVSPLLRERPIFGLLATLNGVVCAFNLGWFFQGTLRFRTSILVEILGFTLNLVTVLFLVRTRDDGWIVLASLFASSVVATSVAHGIALRSLDRTRLRWDGSAALVRESTALFAARGLALMTSSSSTFLISLFAGAKEVGWYGASERLAAAGLSLMLPANQVMIGTVAALVASKDTEQTAFSLIRRGLAVLTGLGVLMCAGALALSGIAVPLILGPEFGPSAGMLRLLGLMFPFAAFSQVISGYVLVPLRRYDRAVSLVALIGAIVTVALTVGLGRPFGGTGVACARVLGYVAMSGALLAVLLREGLVERVLGRSPRLAARPSRRPSATPVPPSPR